MENLKSPVTMNRRSTICVLLLLNLFTSGAFATRPVEETELYKRYVVYAPEPQFPMAALRRGAHGTGVFLLKINPKTGLVEEVKVLKRVGDGGLTAEAVWALLKWRFRPGTVTSVKIPISFGTYGRSDYVH
jgi:TonB family protein